MKTEFRLEQHHIDLLKAAYIRWEDSEYGAPGIDSKRPYGNSSVEYDIAEILGVTAPEYASDEWDDFCERMRKIHAGTEIALQILVACADTGVKPGLYRLRERYGRDWERVGD